MEIQNATPINWLLIRGLAREKRHWGKFPKLLEKSSAGRTFCLDLPGVGEKLNLEAPFSIPEYTEELRREWLEIKNQNPGDWGIIAISLGGMIAMDWASRYPADFLSLTLINSSASNLSPVFKRLQPNALKVLSKLCFQKNTEMREREILSLTTNLIEVNSKIIKKWANIQRDAEASRKTFFRQILAAARFRAPKEIPIPTLILISESDRLTSSDCSKKLATFYGVNYSSHLTAGHDLPLDAPKWIIENLLNFHKPIKKLK